MKTIGIDARFYGSASRGLGRYTSMLLKHLEDFDDKNRYFIYLRKENFRAYSSKKDNFVKKLADIPWYSLKEQFLMKKILDKDKIDLAHFPHFNVPFFYKSPFLVTIHDLILIKYPTIRATTLGPLKYKIKKMGYEQVLKKAINSSEKIIAVSNFTKEDIIKYFPQAAPKIKVIYESCENTKFELKLKRNKIPDSSKVVLEKYGLKKPYLLYVGAAYPHKNLENLLLAFKIIKEKLKKNRLSLVLVGGEDYFYEKIKIFTKRKKIKDVIFPGLVKEESYLREIYAGSEMFVFPSLYEGFGLPPLEAMKIGVPVVCSRVASLPEILGEAAYYFNPQSPKDIAAKVIKVLNNHKFRKDLISRGERRVKLFSWREMARQTLEIYNQILETKRK